MIPKKAICAAFLFNNWAAYHLLARELCASLPASAMPREVSAPREQIAQLLIRAAQYKAVPAIEKKFSINFSDYCGSDFCSFAEQTFSDYESSISRHQIPACQSAAIHLSFCADLPMDPSNLMGSSPTLIEIHKESEQLFIALEDLICDDVQDYLRTKSA